jgi:superfamily II DNA/RNA helicase
MFVALPKLVREKPTLICCPLYDFINSQRKTPSDYHFGTTRELVVQVMESVKALTTYMTVRIVGILVG